MSSSWQVLEELITQNKLQAREPSFWQNSGCIPPSDRVWWPCQALGRAFGCTLDAESEKKRASYKLPIASVLSGVNYLPYCAARSGFAVNYRCAAASTNRSATDFRNYESHLEGRYLNIFFLMFEFPCIVSLYYMRNQQDATLAVSFISHCKITLHVSDAFCVHHQEY